MTDSLIQIDSDPAQRVIASCEQAQKWLSELLESGQIEQIIEVKSQAEALRVYARQKQIGKGAELLAAEVVRRAERCIGLAIRKGQKEGRMLKPGQHAGTDSTSTIRSAWRDARERADGYAMTDDVTDEQFEKAVAQAKADGNLSRANVVRKVKGNGKADRWAGLAELAAEGNTSHQIAKKLGVVRQTVVNKAAKLGIVIHADKVMGKSHLPNPDRVLEEFVGALESLVPSCDLIDVSALSDGVLAECIAIMGDAMKALRKLERRLRGINNDQTTEKKGAARVCADRENASTRGNQSAKI